MKYQLYREQRLNCSLEKAWNFFSSPKNLSTITPADMGFVVVSSNENEPIYEGMLIEYKVSPLLKIRLKWITKITHVDFEKSFTDFQEKGPYKLWNHFHEFVAVEGGVLMKDTVTYELPFGFLGTIAHGLFVCKKLESIFNYRYNVLEKMFNN
ncbi:SRPBCC family protein [Rhizosphaericola mali]|uniref:SRPBCC family protein n=1 Tax=Rhizosphaericola mali TaxID=2545455 RepID=A0A5P2G0X2_9BACT|nr:SRPBCC family protein [Rhizosphaericola mali]QES88308.1 SRPBCC family protein [Rhizosphaericola mali]